MNGKETSRDDEENIKHRRRIALRILNRNELKPDVSKLLDSSLKRHTALIKRMRQSIGLENRDQIIRDLESLALGKYIEEIVSATAEGAMRCKTERDSWSAVEIISMLHRRFPESFTPPLVSSLAQSLTPPSKAHLATLTQEQREKDEAARISRQRSLLRICSELALVGIIVDGPEKSGGEWIMKVLKDLLSNDPALSSLPLLSMFLKSFGRPFLGLAPPQHAKEQISSSTNPGGLSEIAQRDALMGGVRHEPHEKDELIEKETRDRFKRMCEGYFDSISKKLVKEHLKLQEQDRRNHEAYIRSGEIFEDRQQAYEKMTKSYEKMLSSCQVLSELLCVPLPHLPSASEQTNSILLLDGGSSRGTGAEEVTNAGKWEDEEERRYYEEFADLKDFIPRSILGVESAQSDVAKVGSGESDGVKRKEKEEQELKRLEVEMENMRLAASADTLDAIEDDQPTPIPSPPRSPSPTGGTVAPGPSALLTTLLARLSDCTNRSMIDQAAVEFAFLNSKAARKRLVRFLAQVPRNRTDLLPHYSRLVATLNPYMPDVGSELVTLLEEEFRYLQRKKNVVRELTEMRLKNISYLSALTKFGIVPPHLILHIFKVFLDDFTGVNIDNTAMLLEGCGRYLMRTDETREKMVSMVELMRRKQSAQHLDQRQILVLENAYYQCNPPERAPRQQKERTPTEQFIRHLVYDVLSKKTIDKVLRLLRKLDWEDAEIKKVVFSVFTKPWKLKFSNIGLLSLLTYDLQRYHPDFVISVVDQMLEDVRRGLEQNLFKYNQRRVATVKYLGELYIYRLIGSSLVFDTLWLLVTFGYPDGRPVPNQTNPIDARDDFFRIRLVCILLEGCGMCFDRGSLKKKLDAFLTFFQYYVLCKEELPLDVGFMLSDTIEALRPTITMYKTVEEAAEAVDIMFAAAAIKVGGPAADDENDGDSGDEDSDERRDGGRDEEDAINEEDVLQDRPASPEGDALVMLSTTENQGPSEEADSEFAKELAKMLSDTSSDSRKVDKKTALAMWDNTMLSAVSGGRKKKIEEDSDTGSSAETLGVMNFTLLSRRGNKQQARELPIPATSNIAVHTRSAQLQDKVEQQQLKKLVLDYEQREEVEEMKALEASLRSRGMRVKHVS
ncbi:hypothetical protein BS47DRAFT_1321476 [Hydnum rufescens UP504]|uniref:MIF4G domain-containing protein n=1 Tax=Hydnum rufescens UP504 TaxID=1448309 RepID=A0A9P6AKL0_9AGAM|nr:hypothetical protein BS47DRAFT_1321476 [Hydnum rufescens UP504]